MGESHRANPIGEAGDSIFILTFIAKKFQLGKVSVEIHYKISKQRNCTISVLWIDCHFFLQTKMLSPDHTHRVKYLQNILTHFKSDFFQSHQQLRLIVFYSLNFALS